MAVSLLSRVKKFLHALEAIQDELLELYERKRLAITRAEATEMRALAQTEAKLTQTMQGFIQQRQQILNDAGGAQLPSDSILDLVAAVGGDEQPQLEERVVQSRKKSERIRRESWVHWVVSQRALNHYRDLLDLIADHGRKSPTYSHGARRQSTGGAILDASV